MRYLTIYRTAERGVPPTQDEMEAMNRFIGELTAAGKLIATEGCLPSARGASVRRTNGQITVTDGPFSEAKEVIGGFALIRADSKDEAIELARRFLEVAGDGESEIRELYEAPAVAPR